MMPPAEILRRRAEMEADGERIARNAPEMAEERTIHLDTGGYRVPALRVTPKNTAAETPHVFVHGGAWIMGSSRTSLGLLRRMAQQCRRTIISLDYPLAPEAPYPEGINATRAALSLIAAEHGIAGVIAGSAGCHIALGALMGRRESIENPAAILLWNPAVSMRTNTWSHGAFGVGFGLTTTEMQAAALLYSIPDEDPHVDLPSMDLTGLPPVWIACGDRDPLLDDSVRTFVQLTECGCDAHLDIIPGALHGFMNQWFQSKRAEAAVTEALDWLESKCSSP